jgi:ABC-type amino acid transport substrate-binding protein
MLQKNPYIAGNPVGNSPVFVGRRKILQKVQNLVCHPSENAIVLYGQRRMGKTSILQKLAIELPQKGAYYPIFFDLLEKSQWNYSQLLQELANRISDTFGQAIPDLGTDPQTTFERWLHNLLNNQFANASLVLLFDEFDALATAESEPVSTDFFPFLRRLLDKEKTRFNAIFVIGGLPEELMSAALPLIEKNQKNQLPISFLEQQETDQLINLSYIQWEDEAREKIWQLTSGHPFFTQRLCSDILNSVYESHQNSYSTELPAVSVGDVDIAIPKTLEASDNIFEWFWGSLPPAERLVASALSMAEKEQPMTEKQLEEQLSQAGVPIVIQELQKAPHRLSQKDLIREHVEEEVEENQFHFKVELWRVWIAKNKPLHLIQHDLDRVQPMAEHIYQLAIRNYHHGHLDEAVGNLYRAMMHNSDHIGANQLLARIDFETGNPKKAYKTLEKLYDKGDDKSRPLLVEVLLYLGSSEKNEEEKIKYYQQVLELEPKNVKAKEEFQKIWQRRAEKSYKEHKLEEAEKCYKNANLDGQFEKKITDIKTEIKQQEQLNKWYLQGIGALQEGDNKTAQNCLKAVINKDLTYKKEAILYLYQAVTGIDIKKRRKIVVVVMTILLSCAGFILLKNYYKNTEIRKELSQVQAAKENLENDNQGLEHKITELSNIFNNINKYKRFIALVREHVEPFSYKKEGKWVGFEIDLLREFARRWFPDHKEGVIFHPMITDHYRDSSLIDSNRHIVAGVLSQEKSQGLNYSIAYFEYDKGLLVRKIDGINEFCDIKGKEIAIVQDAIKKEYSITKKILEAARKKQQCDFKEILLDNIKWYDNYSKAFKALQQKTVKAVVGDRILLKGLLKETSNDEAFKIISSEIEELYSFGVPNKYHEKWLKLIDLTLNEMKKDNSYRRIYCKWFPDETAYSIKTDDSKSPDKQLLDMAWAEEPLSTDEFPKCSQSKSDYPISYKVKDGDTLWDLSKKYYGTFVDWEYISDKNQGKPVLSGNSQNGIQTGEILIIPEPPQKGKSLR